MHILLNATREEIERLGGDYTHYRDWLRLSHGELSFHLVAPALARRCQALVRMAAEAAARTWQPRWIRRRLLLLSRCVYLPPSAAVGADLVFSHLMFPLRPPRGTPVVWNSQGISPPRYYQIANRGRWDAEDVAYLYRRLGGRADALVVFTETCARNLTRRCPELKEKTFVVPAAVFPGAGYTGPKPSIEDGILRLLFVGADARRKGLEELVHAYGRLSGQHWPIQLEIVSRPGRDLQARIAMLRGVRLHLTSPRIDVKRLMAEADLFILPTHADTYALAVVEAMAHGCAVVISDLEPLPEVAPPSEVGLTVPAGDSDALYQALSRLASSPALLRRLQRNARARYLRHHAPEVVTSRLESLFADVSRRTRPGRPAAPAPLLCATSARDRGPSDARRTRAAVVASHPTQVQAAVYRRLAMDPRLEVLVAYCSMQGAQGGIDPEFGTEIKWDVPLLDGYPWTQLPNRSPWPGVGRFFGLVNPGLWRLLRHGRYDVAIVHTGYGHLSYWIALAAAKASRTPVIFATDACGLAPRDGRRWKAWAKPFAVPYLYRLNEVVAAASSSGRDFVQGLGIPEHRVVLVPNAVDNDWWSREAARADRSGVRARWGVPESAPVVLFCAKLQPWKRPTDLLRAFALAGVEGSHLVYAGVGPLRPELESEAASRGILGRVRFLGFVNQSNLPGVYRAADLLALPSEHEPWGFVLNEAMACGCPVVVADRVGAARDLVRPGLNGFVYPCGDVETLAGILRAVLPDRACLGRLAAAAHGGVEGWSVRENVDAMLRAIETAIRIKGV